MRRNLQIDPSSPHSPEPLNEKGHSFFGDQKCAYTIPNFCWRYSTSRAQDYKEIAAGRLKVTKIGRRTLIAGEDAIAWFERPGCEPAAS